MYEIKERHFDEEILKETKGAVNRLNLRQEQTQDDESTLEDAVKREGVYSF